MPIPKPMKDEDKNKFMSRCIGFMHSENKKKPDKDKWMNDQMVAICYSQWRKKDSTASVEDKDERERDAEFVKRFVAKYPMYKTYFEPEKPIDTPKEE